MIATVVLLGVFSELLAAFLAGVVTRISSHVLNGGQSLVEALLALLELLPFVSVAVLELLVVELLAPLVEGVLADAFAAGEDHWANGAAVADSTAAVADSAAAVELRQRGWLVVVASGAAAEAVASVLQPLKADSVAGTSDVLRVICLGDGSAELADAAVGGGSGRETVSAVADFAPGVRVSFPHDGGLGLHVLVSVGGVQNHALA